jgi:hypothetical protein
LTVGIPLGIPLVDAGEDSKDKIRLEEIRIKKEKKVKEVMDNISELERLDKKFPMIDKERLSLEVIKMVDRSILNREIKNCKNFVENRFKDKKT